MWEDEAAAKSPQTLSPSFQSLLMLPALSWGPGKWDGRCWELSGYRRAGCVRTGAECSPWVPPLPTLRHLELFWVLEGSRAPASHHTEKQVAGGWQRTHRSLLLSQEFKTPVLTQLWEGTAETRCPCISDKGPRRREGGQADSQGMVFLEPREGFNVPL